MPKERFPEITACKAAAKAVEDFDRKHAARAEAIKKVALMLQQGGWEAVKITDQPPSATFYAEDGDTVYRDALRGDPIETIVLERRQLVRQWQEAYRAVPEEIRASAPGPGTPGRVASTRPQGRRPHG